jgi:hypothetical protein
MKNWLPIIFAVDKQISIGVNAFNHCSSLCPSESGVVLAWYAGSGECQDDQNIYLVYLSQGKSSTPLRIGDKTGNPIVWREDNKNWLLWSKFEDDGPMTSLAQRWRYCSLWTQQIKCTPNIKLLGEPQRLAKSSDHLLARTGPLIQSKLTILPLYDEVNRECVIYQGSNGDFNETSRFGGTNHIIQPTIWLENRRLHSLNRNFGNGRHHALYYFSDDYGHSWKFGGLSHFWNINNSLAICKYKKQHVVLWNNLDSQYRRNMSIGIVEWANTVPHPHSIRLLNKEHGSYPCLCVSDDDSLHFAYTNPLRQIEYHVWNRKTFNKYLRRS